MWISGRLSIFTWKSALKTPNKRIKTTREVLLLPGEEGKICMMCWIVYTHEKKKIHMTTVCSTIQRSMATYSIWVNWRSQDVKSWFISALKSNFVVLCLDFALRWHFTGLKRQLTLSHNVIFLPAWMLINHKQSKFVGSL